MSFACQVPGTCAFEVMLCNFDGFFLFVIGVVFVFPYDFSKYLKKVVELFCCFDKKPYLCTRFRKNLSGSVYFRSLKDWNRERQDKASGHFMSGGPEVHSDRNTIQFPFIMKHDKRVRVQTSRRARAARQGFGASYSHGKIIFTMKSLILAQDER